MGYITNRILIGLLLCLLISINAIVVFLSPHKIVSGISAIFTIYFTFMFVAIILFSKRPNKHYPISYCISTK